MIPSRQVHQIYFPLFNINIPIVLIVEFMSMHTIQSVLIKSPDKAAFKTFFLSDKWLMSKAETYYATLFRYH